MLLLHSKQSLPTFIERELRSPSHPVMLPTRRRLTIAVLLPSCLILSDEKNHASIIAGIRASGAEEKIFWHNDLDHLESLLREADSHRSKVIASASVYSMDGDTAPIERICDLAVQ
jgi:7-keto-8-aminopelargonate synthetase-like enzyme